MSNCPKCGIDRKDLSSPCLICGYADASQKASSESKNHHSNSKQCPFCGEDIQIVAIKCKHCGEFLNSKNNGSNVQNKVQTIELTSKYLKAAEMFSILLTIVSFLLMTGGCTAGNGGLTGFGLLGFLGGLVWFISVRASIYWNHG